MRILVHIKSAVAVLSIFLIPMQSLAEGESFSPRIAGHVTHLQNDALVFDGNDRWRTGSGSTSLFFETDARLYELRGRVEVITPWNAKHKPVDRAATGVFGIGLFAHENMGKNRVSYGLEYVRTSSKILGLQEFIHESLDSGGYSHERRQSETVPDESFISFKGELSREYRPTQYAVLRPYTSVQLGFDTHFRLGLEAVIGSSGFPLMSARDPVTGFSIPATPTRSAALGSGGAINLHLGADISFGHDDYTLNSGLVTPSPVRTRLRAGAQINTGRVVLFYGVALLSREFKEQKEAQMVGAASLNIRF
ncbi:DUF2219 family protein [Halovulum dunhuangense]|uniref:DUF2219 family protein n=1 Tax=Halovulum dunhuangense TaxID=1505036 RepID=A0A849L6H3_9RHOB|nr:lipid A-modifier LpxR family protein [Halovulum dunhuangense]NNU82045.1 DUF2219 family protein [Halovulum dunhuangense]